MRLPVPLAVKSGHPQGFTNIQLLCQRAGRYLCSLSARMATQPPLAKRLAQGTLWSFISTGTQLVVALGTAPIFYHTLGGTLYGTLILIGTVIAYAELLDLGITYTCIRHTSAALATGHTREAYALVGTAWSIQGIFGLIGAAGVWLAAEGLMVDFFHTPLPYISQAVWALRISALSFFINFLGGVPATVATSHGRFDIYGRLSTVSTLLKALGGVGVALGGYGLIGVVSVYLLVDGLVCSTNIFIASRFMPYLMHRIWFSWKAFKKIWGFSWAVFLSGMLTRILAQWERILMGRYVGVAEVPYFSVPHSLASRFVLVPGAFGGTLLSELSTLYARSERERARALFKRIFRYVWLLLFPLTLFLTMGGKPLLSVWMGPAFAEKTTFVWIWLMWGGLFQAFGQLGNSWVHAQGAPYKVALLYALLMLVYMPIAYGMVKAWGMIGLAQMWGLKGIAEGIGLIGLAVGFSIGEIREGLAALQRRGAMLVLFWAGMWACLYLWVLRELPLLWQVILGSGLFWIGILAIIYKRGLDRQEVEMALDSLGLTFLKKYLP